MCICCRGEVTWSSNVTQQFIRSDWRVRAGYISRNVTMLVTPKVVVSMSANMTSLFSANTNHLQYRLANKWNY